MFTLLEMDVATQKRSERRCHLQEAGKRGTCPSYAWSLALVSSSCSVSNRHSATLLHRCLLLAKQERIPWFHMLAHSQGHAKASLDNSVPPGSTLTPCACEGGRRLICSPVSAHRCTQPKCWDERCRCQPQSHSLVYTPTGEFPLPLHLYSSHYFRVSDLDWPCVAIRPGCEWHSMGDVGPGASFTILFMRWHHWPARGPLQLLWPLVINVFVTSRVSIITQQGPPFPV